MQKLSTLSEEEEGSEEEVVCAFDHSASRGETSSQTHAKMNEAQNWTKIIALSKSLRSVAETEMANLHKGKVGKEIDRYIRRRRLV